MRRQNFNFLGIFEKFYTVMSLLFKYFLEFRLGVNERVDPAHPQNHCRVSLHMGTV